MAHTALAPRRNASHTTNSFWWIDAMTTDVPAVRKFYADVLGWQWDESAMPDGSSYWMAKLDGLAVAGLGAQSAELTEMGVPPMWNSYILVDSVDDYVKKIEAAGGTIVALAMEASDAGRFAFATDPTSGSFGIWEAKEFVGADAVNQPGTLVWNGLWTSNVEQARAFYTAVFGWSFNESDMMGMPYWMITLDGQTPIAGLAEKTAGMPGPPSVWTVTLGVADADTVKARIEKAGGQVMAGPHDTPQGKHIVALDPAGAMVEFIELNEWPA